MSRTVPIPTALAAAILLAVGVAVVATLKPAQAAFPGNNGKIAFVRHGASDSYIFTMKPNGTGTTKIPTRPHFDDTPSWSPDGEKIAFSKFVRRSGGEIFKMNAADGSQKRNLTDTPRAQEHEPDWSPDGTKVAYTSFTEANGAFDRVFTMNADGSDQTNLTGREGGWSPSWSPAGGKIVFVSVHPNARSFDLFVMEADGTEVERLTTTQSFEFAPTWQPLP